MVYSLLGFSGQPFPVFGVLKEGRFPVRKRRARDRPAGYNETPKRDPERLDWSLRMGKCLLAAILVACLAPAASAQTVLVAEGDLWKFFRGRAEPDMAWASLGFDASTWEEGPTGIGYEDGDDATILDDMLNAYVSVYLRIEFDVPANLSGFQWILRARYDDGFVAYLDGNEVARRGVDGFPPAFDALAVNHEVVTAAPGAFDETISLPSATASLTQGRHVLAVQVHNTTLDSSDLSFSAELSAWPFIATSVDPAFGPLDGGTRVRIGGVGFGGGGTMRVFFGGVLSPSVLVLGPEALEAEAPPGAVTGTVDIEIQDDRGSFVLPGAFRYVGAGGTGLTFDGGDFATVSAFPGGLGEGTIELWFTRAAEGWFGSWRVLVAIEAPGGADLFRLETRGTRIRARIWAGEDDQRLTVDPAIDLSTWHHFALVFAADGRKIYLDGTLVGSDEITMTVAPGARFRLGAGFGQSAMHMGDMESLRIWSAPRALRDLRRMRYAAITGGADLVGSWSLDDGTGQMALDSGPNEFDFVLGSTTGAEDTDPAWGWFETFPAVAVTDIDPASGPIEGGGAVSIWGLGFDGETAPEVLFGETPAASVTVLESWLLEAIAPAVAEFGKVDVTVRTRQGAAVLPQAYLYQPEATYAFVREGDIADYFVGVSAPPGDWISPGFDAAAAGWSRGPSGFGYGDADDGTDLPEMLDTTLTVYARHEWDMPGRGEPITYLRFRIRYDDGYVAYLNGEEIARMNIAGEPPLFDEPASALHEITVGPGEFDEEIDLLGRKGLLVKGRNVLAIEAHNESLDSTDISLSAELLYSAPGKRFLRGDLDGNGSRTITDAIRTLQGLFGGWTIRCPEAADANDDGAYDLADGVFLLEFLFIGGPRPPIPFDYPLPDLDGDPLNCP
jgi:hypothetical protein